MMSRIIITLPDEMLASLDLQASKSQQSRSALMRTVLADWVAERKRAEFEELLADGYRERASRLEEFATEFAEVQAAALDGTWRWGE